MEAKTEMKFVVVGNAGVGKTCLLFRYASNSFQDEHIPTVFDSRTVSHFIDNKPIIVTLWDTAGQEEYDTLRPVSYPLTDVFLVCFSVNNIESFLEVEKKWLPEVKHHVPRANILLVGTKCDSRKFKWKECDGQLPLDEVHPGHVSLVEQTWKAMGYVECSAKHNVGVMELFEKAIRGCLRNSACVSYRRRRSSTCDLV